MLYIAAFFINIIDNNTNYINGIVFFTINLIFSKVCFDMSIKSCIFHSTFLFAVMFLTELVTEAVAGYLIQLPMDAHKNSLSVLIIIGSISKILYLFVCKFVSSLFSYKNQLPHEKRQTFALFLYPLITTVTLATFLYASNKYNFSKYLDLVCALISIISLIFCCFIFIYNRFVQQQQNELVNLQIQNQKTELNSTFYTLLEQKNQEQRVLVHDMKHHFYAINSLDSVEDIRNYLSNLEIELDKNQFIGNSNNKTLDLILSKYYQICSTKNIDFFVDVRKSNLSFIEDNDLVSLLGNLLDNAVEATSGLDNSRIRFTTNKEHNFEIISVINTSNQKPTTHHNKLITTKENASLHGYGIKSIEKTAEKYNGVCEWSYDDKNEEFHFSVLFNR